MRVVLGSLGRIARLPQLRPRHRVKQSFGGPLGGWQKVSVRDMACATLSTGEGERMLESTGEISGEGIEVWLSALAELDPELALTLDEEPLAVTLHGWDCLLQILCEEPLATRLLQDPKALSHIEMAAKLLSPDMEIHVTWEVK